MQRCSMDATLSPYARFWNVMKHKTLYLQKIHFVDVIKYNLWEKKNFVFLSTARTMSTI